MEAVAWNAGWSVGPVPNLMDDAAASGLTQKCRGQRSGPLDDECVVVADAADEESVGTEFGRDCCGSLLELGWIEMRQGVVESDYGCLLYTSRCV